MACYEMEISTASQNAKNRDIVVKHWNLLPEKASVIPTANKEEWSKIAKVWNISEKEARRRLCANCEYYDNTDYMMAQMEKIPLDKFDLDGGGRGYCHKFEFICHNLRTCQAWETKDFELQDEEEDYKPMMSRNNPLPQNRSR